MKSVLFALLVFLPQGPQAEAPGSIEGFVIKLGTSTPILRARVDVRKENARSLGILTTTTDASGKFTISNLPPGRYRVSASHDGYVSGQYGDRNRGGQGTVITLEAKQDLKDIVIAITPKGAISGRVYDRFGDPVVNASVQAMKHAYQDGRRILIPVDNARTNDLGEYRLFWLAPGPYIISAATTAADRSPVPVADAPEIYLPVYVPGTTDAATASLIDVPAGTNLTGVDVQIAETRAVRVRGRVVNGATGRPAPGTAITLVPRRGTVATGSSQRAGMTGAGAFEFRHMAPGSYDLVASVPNGGGGRLAAHKPISIAGADVDDVELVLQPQFSINARITFDSPAPTIPSMSGIRVELRREPFTPELLILLPAVSPDGTFTLAGVTPGDYQIKVTTGGLKGYTKAARFGAIDALNPPFHIESGDAQLEIVISTNSGSLDGIVLGAAQKPFSGATVVLVPDPSRRQRFDLYYVVGSDPSGRIHFDSIAPGDYKIFAWDDVPADAWQDPDFLRAYEDRGKPVHISEGSKENIELRLVPRR